MSTVPPKPTDLRDCAPEAVAAEAARLAYARVDAYRQYDLSTGATQDWPVSEQHCWAAGFQQGYLLAKLTGQRRRSCR